jgi:tRNA 2-thiouridine synthesizing protein A
MVNLSMTHDPADIKSLDARHLACPLPVLKARKVLLGMAPGSRLQVLATDPAAKRDFPEFADVSGHLLIEMSDEPDGVFRFVLERG